ncbi:MAG: hypothetical protein GX879_01060 [Bacteroidales bacterium]|nr:hypothetical protein [Bacteroidales bacterium]
MSLMAQNTTDDKNAFYEVQNKLQNSKSGFLNFRLNYSTDNFEFFWDAELNFIRNSENKLYFYLKTYEDIFVNEFVYFNDTLLVLAEDKDKKASFKEATQKPFERNIRREFIYLLNNVDLNFINLETVNIYDTVWISNDAAKVGEIMLMSQKVDMHTKEFKQIVAKLEDYSLLFYKIDRLMYTDTNVFLKNTKEYLIDSAEYYENINVAINNLIEEKYTELNKIIDDN